MSFGNNESGRVFKRQISSQFERMRTSIGRKVLQTKQFFIGRKLKFYWDYVKCIPLDIAKDCSFAVENIELKSKHEYRVKDKRVVSALAMDWA